MKKLLTCLALCCVMALSLAMFACTDNPGDSTSGHQHTFETVNKVEATCQTAGTKEHQVCLYCHKLFIDGKEVSESDIVIPIDANAHKYKDVAEKPSTCVEKGVAAHKECEICHKLFNADKKEVAATELELPVSATAHVYTEVAKVDPADCVTAGMEAHLECTSCHKLFNAQKNEVTAESLKIAPKGAHTFDAKTHKCADCSAYQVKVGENYYAIDNSNNIAIKGTSLGTTHKPNEMSKWAPVLAQEGNTFALQVRTGGTKPVESGVASVTKDGKWLIENATYVHTRTCYYNGDTAYVGSFVYTFDITVNEDSDIFAVGVAMADQAGSWDPAVTGIGNASNFAGTRDGVLPTSMKQGVTYRFVYVLTKTAADQLIQFYTCTTDKSLATKTLDYTISNVHAVPNVTGTFDCANKLLYCGEASGYPIVEGKCPADNGEHDMQAHTAVAPTCTEAGNIDYYYCTKCKTNFSDVAGTKKIEGEVTIPATGHVKEAHAAAEASCVATAHDAYVYCSDCEKYFTDETCATETTFAAIYGGKEIADHNYGDDGVCTVCGTAKKTLVQGETVGLALNTDAKTEAAMKDNTGKIYFSTAVTTNKYGNYLAVENDTVVTKGRDKDTKSYVRFNPTADGTTSFVGKFIFAFDVTISGTETLTFDCDTFIVAGKTPDGKDDNEIGRTTRQVTMTGGKTYRFAFEVELKDMADTACEYFQFSLKIDSVKVNITYSNVSFKFNSGTAENKESITSKAFAALVKEEAKPEAQA